MKKVILAFIVVIISSKSFAELRFGLAYGERQLDIFRKELPQIEDDARYVGLEVGVYRAVNTRWSVGAVGELLYPLSRDQAPGTGRIIGFRPVNLVRQFGPLRAEAFGGVAQYDWVKKASGYYLGLDVSMPIKNSPFAVGFGYKYFQDLAHDAYDGDHIVDGPAVAMKIDYKFD